MEVQELIDLHTAIKSICRDSKEIVNGNFTIAKMKKLDEDLEYVKDFLEEKLIENTSIKKESSVSQLQNQTDNSYQSI